MQRDILGRNAEKDLGIRTRNLATATPLKSTSVTDGHTEFNGNESLLVKGSQLVSGWLIITGTLKGVGSLIWEKAVLFSGVFTMTGPTHLNGPTDVTDTLDVTAEATFQGATTIQNSLDVTAETRMRGATTIENTLDVAAQTTLRGVTELLADLKVKNSGKITIEGVRAMLIGLLSTGYPGIEFPAARMTSTANGLLLSTSAGGGQLGLSPTLANLSVGSTSVSMNGAMVSVLGPFTTTDDVFLKNLPLKSGVTANVYADPETGQLSIA
jgi:hypothetical protein